MAFGLALVDEIVVNFWNRPRNTRAYVLNQWALLATLGWAVLWPWPKLAYGPVIHLGLLGNLSLALSLTNLIGLEKIKRWATTPALLVLLPSLSLVFLSNEPHGQRWAIVLLLTCIGSDTGAWFWGRRLGRHKLWPSISPHKTLEGGLGGILSGATIGTLAWWVSFGGASWKVPIGTMALAAVSQIGDLCQSKMKRMAKIKDSSRLIPGHGGTYDLLDSILFAAPALGAVAFWWPH